MAFAMRNAVPRCAKSPSGCALYEWPETFIFDCGSLPSGTRDGDHSLTTSLQTLDKTFDEPAVGSARLGELVIPNTTGNLVSGNLLIGNFKAKSNLQGTGTTLMQISPDGTARQFAKINAAHLLGFTHNG
jgi:hypothetical protein